MHIPDVPHDDWAVVTTLRQAAELEPDERDVVTIVELAVAAARQQDSDHLAFRAGKAYADAVRLDAFAPDDARQAFLEGYVRGTQER